MGNKVNFKTTLLIYILNIEFYEYFSLKWESLVILLFCLILLLLIFILLNDWFKNNSGPYYDEQYWKYRQIHTQYIA